MNIFYKASFILILTSFSSEVMPMGAAARAEARYCREEGSYSDGGEALRAWNRLRSVIASTNNVNVLNDAVIQAIELNAKVIVEEAIAKGANNLEKACQLAEQNGRAEIASFIRPKLAELVKNVRMNQFQQALTPDGEKLPPLILNLVMAYSDHNEKTWAEDKGLCSIQ